jgi:methylmalonyl-CoA mutase N-terminal domain/subunit
VADVVDPLGGSYYVESLTTRLEEEAEALIREVLDRGGMVQSIEDGFIQRQIADASAAYQRALEAKSEYIVGVNIHVRARSAASRSSLSRSTRVWAIGRSRARRVSGARGHRPKSPQR